MSPYDYFGKVAVQNPYAGMSVTDPQEGPAPVPQPGTMGALLLELAPMESVMPLLGRMGFGLAFLSIDDASVQVLEALDWIGSRYSVRYVVELSPDETGRLDLPDNCQAIDAVLGGSLSRFQGRAATTLNERLWCASQVFRRGKSMLSDPHTPFQGDVWGHPVASQLVIEPGAAHLQVPAGTGSVLISYRARYVDDRGWPLITPKQALASAHYMRFIAASDRYYAQELPENIYESVKKEWEQSCGLARNEGLGDKQGLQRLLDAKTSYHRHSYGSRIKL
jgi:hypothetical protein